jgi:hypothetical protein
MILTLQYAVLNQSAAALSWVHINMIPFTKIAAAMERRSLDNNAVIRRRWLILIP